MQVIQATEYGWEKVGEMNEKGRVEEYAHTTMIRSAKQIEADLIVECNRIRRKYVQKQLDSKRQR